MRHRLTQVVRTWAIAALVAWVMLLAAALGSTTSVADAAERFEQRRDTPQTSVEKVSKTVMCPSCDTTLDLSNSPAAESMREWVREAVDAGWTEQEIRDGLVAEYDGDESILATPRAHGLGLLAWLVPVVVVLVAALGGVVLMRGWRRGSRHVRAGGSSSQPSSSTSSHSASSTSSSDGEAPSSSSAR